ncbi:MAG: MmcQ/YjbR family DNA-binding protein [Pseudorhodobacter sp.]
MSDDLRARVARIAGALPGTAVDDPWGGGHDAWKVGGKMFACIGSAIRGVCVKTPDSETATLLIEAGRAVKAPYFHHSWVLLPETVEDADLRHRIHTSYRLIRAGLPAGLRKSLPEPNEG